MNACLAACRRWGWLATLSFFLALPALAQTLPSWTHTQAGSSGAQVAVDAGNHSLVAGSVAGAGMQLSKFSPAGTLLWQRNLTAPGVLARASGLALDAAGNSIVVGVLTDGISYTQGAVVVKVDAAGNVLWQDTVPALHGGAYAALAASNGDAVVLGRQVVAGVQDITVTRYSATGARLWTRTWGANTASTTHSMVFTPAGLLAVAGRSLSISEAVIAVFDAAGNPVWNGHLASSIEPGITVTPAGELVVVGGVSGSFMVTKYNPGFGPAWWRTYAARGHALRAAVDAAGNVVVSGVTDVNTGSLAVVQYAWLTMKLDAAGNQLWTHTLAGGASFGGDTPYALALGADGATYLSGQSRVPLATGGSSANTTTLKLGANGIPLWQANAPATPNGLSLALTADQGVLTLGDAPQTLYRYAQSGLPNQAPMALASASPSAGPAPLSVQFSANGSSDADGLIASYRWDFGDGSSSTIANPAHTYAAGSYTARLTVTDTLGASSAAASVVVSANAVVLPAQPTAFTLTSASVVGGKPLQATVRVSTTAGATVVLSSSNTAVAKLPASVVIPAGANSATFTVTTLSVKRDTAVTLTAKANNGTAAATLMVKRR